MGIFKKTIKYSKPSKDLDHKIKKLDEELKQTGIIEDQNDPEVFVVQEEKELPKIYDEVEVEKKEEFLYNWRETFAVEDIGETQNIVEDVEYKTVQKVESYISESNRELIEIRDQVFQEISETTLLNLPEIKSKIEKVLEIYDQIQEGLLNEPPDVKNSDPLTPLDQKFVTVDELNKHYSLFINRIQEQLATLGGGGETRLKYLDDIVGIATNASAYDGKFLKYDHPLGQFVFETVSGGGGGNTDYANVAGIATYASTAGISTYASTAGVSTSVIGGIASVTQLNVSGVSTLTGNTFVGSAITMYASTGIISATSFYGNFVGSITDATNLTGGTANASTLNVSGIATISQGRIQVDAASNLRFGNLPAGSGSGRNIAIGDQVLVSLSGGQGRNIGIGELSYYDTTSGQYNIGLGIQAGQKITTGSYNVIIGGYNGQTGLDIRTSSNNVVIADGQGNIRQYINSSGNVGIKTTVITEALTVAGIVSATGFYGSLNAGQLTGSLPAIDGSALIGVVGSGSGVIIRDDGSPVGTAGTIDFGSNLSVSFASGIATITGSGLATYANVAGIATYASTAGVSTTSGTATYASTAGVSTTSGTAGYATTAGISSAVSATININTTGIITASSFSGSGSGLTNLPSGQLTGALPAIDGSALLNVTAAGTGVAIEDNNVNVGSATTINFGTGLDVTFASGIATVTSSGGSLQSRTTVSGATTSIANNGIGNTNITGFKSYALMKVGLSTAGWIRLYTDSTSRTNDASRSIGIDPSPGSGVIAEVITTGISTTQIISPFVMGGNLNNPADTTIYAAITNLSGTTQAITANLTILQLEA